MKYKVVNVATGEILARFNCPEHAKGFAEHISRTQFAGERGMVNVAVLDQDGGAVYQA